MVRGCPPGMGYYELISNYDGCVKSRNSPPPYEEVRERVLADYLQWETEKTLTQFLTRLKEKAIIEIKL